LDRAIFVIGKLGSPRDFWKIPKNKPVKVGANEVGKSFMRKNQIRLHCMSENGDRLWGGPAPKGGRTLTAWESLYTFPLTKITT